MGRYNGPLAKWLKKVILANAEGFSSTELRYIEDPWLTVLGEEKTREIIEDGNALCVNCLHPESEPVIHCEYCGCTTGHYAVYMPYIYLFLIGRYFRSGVDGSVKLTKFRVVGLVVTCLVEYSIFAPFYLYRLYRAARGYHVQNVRSQKGEKSTLQNPGNTDS